MYSQEFLNDLINLIPSQTNNPSHGQDFLKMVMQGYQLQDNTEEEIEEQVEKQEVVQSEEEEENSFIKEFTNSVKPSKKNKIRSRSGTTSNSSFGDMSSIISGKESGGNYGALPYKKDGTLASSAVGKYQFLWGTRPGKGHGDRIKAVTGVKTKEEFRNSPEAQEKYFQYYMQNEVAPQVSKYRPSLQKLIPGITDEQIIQAYHFAGPGNIEKAIATGNTSMKLDGFGSSIDSYIGRKKYGNGGKASSGYQVDIEGIKKGLSAAYQQTKPYIRGASAIGQYVPVPWIKYPSMAINAAIGVDDFVNSESELDKAENTLSLVPQVSGPEYLKGVKAARGINALGPFTKSLGIFGTALDIKQSIEEINNGSKKQNIMTKRKYAGGGFVGPQEEIDFMDPMLTNYETNPQPVTTGVTQVEVPTTPPVKDNSSLSFSKAFAQARKELGANQTFHWNGKNYSTNYANEKPKSKSSNKGTKSVRKSTDNSSNKPNATLKRNLQNLMGIPENILKKPVTPTPSVGKDFYSRLIQAGLQDAQRRGYANGGIVPIEAEGDEVMETPDGLITELQGASHEQGGIDVNVPEGTKIYSDRIQVDGKTMAQRKKSRERSLAKLEKALGKNPGNNLLRNTLQRTMSIHSAEEARDMAIQEAANMSGQNKFAGGTGNFGVRPDTFNPNTIYKPYSRVADQIPYLPIMGDITPSMSTPINSVEADAMGFSSTPESSIASTKPLTIPSLNKSSESLDANLNGLGNYLGMAGNIFNGIIPLLNTEANRQATKPSENFYQNFGKDAIESNSMAIDSATKANNNAISELRSRINASRDGIRRGSNSINTIRAMEALTDIRSDNGIADLQQSLNSQIAQLLGQRSSLQNQRDQVVMSGEQQRDQADRANIDNYYSNRGQDLLNLGANLQGLGKNLGALEENSSIRDLINQIGQFMKFNKQNKSVKK